MPKNKDFEEQISEVITLKEDKTVSKYDSPDVISYVVEHKNKNETFAQIAKGLQERGFEGASSGTVSKIYNKAIARSVRTHNTANEKFTDFSADLDDMNKTRMGILKSLLDNIKTFAEEVEKTNELSILDKKKVLFRFYPQMTTLLAEFNRVIQSYKEDQDKIIQSMEMEGQKWNISNMNEYIQKYLKTLESNGQIRIIDESLK